MRTRRSHRNQDQLFAYLFKPKAVPSVPRPPRTDAEIDALYHIPRWQRERMKAERDRKHKHTSRPTP